MEAIKKTFSFPQSASRWVPILTFLAIVIFFSFASDAFLTERNLTNLTRQVSVNCILAFGMTMIILIGAIDLSIGSLLALGAVVGALLQQKYGWMDMGIGGTLLSSTVVLLLCALVGSFTGFTVAKFKVPPFVVTLGILVIARGLALLLSDGSRIGPLSDSYRWLGTSFVSPQLSFVLIIITAVAAVSFILFRHQSWIQKAWQLLLCVLLTLLARWIFVSYQGIPIPVLMSFCVFGIVFFLLERTVFGRYVYAIGGNAEAARLCGIRVPHVLFIVYVLMGSLVGLSALIESGRIDAGDPNAGNLYELDAIAAVVIGGTSLKGGVGRVTGTLLGAFLIGTLNNGMSLLNVPTNTQMVIKGVIIILAVLMDTASKNRQT